MRCPICGDEYEDGVILCVDCGAELVPEGTELAPSAPEADTRLGRFHPAVADRISNLLYRRAIIHQLRSHDDGVEVLVEMTWRDDLRAEFAVSWSEIIRGLEEQDAAEVMAAGGSAPGWIDAPRGGYVDRTGRMVVGVDAEDAEADASRLVGPAMMTTGVIAAVAGWYLFSSTALVVAGVGLAIIGLLNPR